MIGKPKEAAAKRLAGAKKAGGVAKVRTAMSGQYVSITARDAYVGKAGRQPVRLFSAARRSRLPADYLHLLERFPLRPIRSHAEYDRAAAVLDDLVGRHDLTPGQSDYLDTLTLLVEAFDAEHYPPGPSRRTPLERLKYLMESSGTTQAKMGEIIGSPSAASMVLGGTRELSKAHIRRLAEHFKLNPGYFL